MDLNCFMSRYLTLFLNAGAILMYHFKNTEYFIFKVLRNLHEVETLLNLNYDFPPKC